MSNDHSFAAFDFWRSTHHSPYHFPMEGDQWCSSMYEDVDSDGKKLFEKLFVRFSRAENAPRGVFNGIISYGTTAFGFAENGELSNQVHHCVIRDLYFPQDHPEIGQRLLAAALHDFENSNRVYAFFHYFGMSACARHGKLHESEAHIHNLLLENDFSIEHENVYYSRDLTAEDAASDIVIQWKPLNAGHCREFAAIADGREIGWGQVHFLPQGYIAYLRWIYIDEKLQHQGYGSRVMRSLFAQLYAMGIRRFDTDTARNNLAAQGYYEKTGFQNEGITRSYYR